MIKSDKYFYIIVSVCTILVSIMVYKMFGGVFASFTAVVGIVLMLHEFLNHE